MIGHAFQISDGTMEKDFDVAFFPTFVKENDWSDGGDDFETVSTKYAVAVGCCHLSCTRRLQFSPKCTQIVGGWGSAPDPAGGAYSAPPDPLAALD